MATNGLGSGLKQGVLQGAKTGVGQAPLRSGFVGGISDANVARDKIQDPNLLRGEKLPWIYANADNTVSQNNYTAILDLMNLPVLWNQYKGITTTSHPDWLPTAGFINGTYARTGKSFSSNGINDYVALGSSANTAARAYPYVGGEDLGDHVYLDMGGSTGTATNHVFAPANGVGTFEDSLLLNIAPSALTIMMVMKSKNTAGKTHFMVEGNIVPGGIYFSQPTTSTLRLQLYSASGVSSIYDSSNLSTELQDWILVTIKCTLKQINGQGSEQIFFINGKPQHQFISTNWTTPEATTTWSATSQATAIGTDSATEGSVNSNGMYFASFLMLPYWANESEQLRLENYFRWYYGKKF